MANQQPPEDKSSSASALDTLIAAAARQEPVAADGNNNRRNPDAWREEKKERIVAGEPRETDVLFGRGKRYTYYPGNLAMHSITDQFLTMYKVFDRSPEAVPRMQAECGFASKRAIVNKCIDMIQDTGARFLKYDEKVKSWVEVGLVEARAKVAHILRGKERKGHDGREFKSVMKKRERIRQVKPDGPLYKWDKDSLGPPPKTRKKQSGTDDSKSDSKPAAASPSSSESESNSSNSDQKRNSKRKSQRLSSHAKRFQSDDIEERDRKRPAVAPARPPQQNSNNLPRQGIPVPVSAPNHPPATTAAGAYYLPQGGHPSFAPQQTMPSPMGVPMMTQPRVIVHPMPQPVALAELPPGVPVVYHYYHPDPRFGGPAPLAAYGAPPQYVMQQEDAIMQEARRQVLAEMEQRRRFMDAISRPESNYHAQAETNRHPQDDDDDEEGSDSESSDED